MKKYILILALLPFFFCSNTQSQTCPAGFSSLIQEANATLYDENSIGDKDNVDGMPDGAFAKLDHANDFLILKLDKTITAGLDLTLHVASEDGNTASGTIEFSADGVNFQSSSAYNTNIQIPNAAEKSFTVSQDFDYIRIKRTGGVLMIDAAESQFQRCRFDEVEDINVVTCYNTSKYICLNDLIPSDGAFNYKVNILDVPQDGIVVGPDYTYDFCDADKVDELEFVYLAKPCSDAINGQSSDQCTDFEQLRNEVYIKVAEDENPFSNSSKIYFSGAVSLHDFFTAKSALESQDKFPKDIYVHIYNTNADTVLQSMKIKTDCGSGDPMLLQDGFGSVVVVGFHGMDGNTHKIEKYCQQQMFYIPNEGFIGYNLFNIEVCDLIAPSLCRNAAVVLQVLDSNAQACLEPTTKIATVGLCPNTPYEICLNDFYNLGGDTGVFGNTSYGYDINYLNNSSNFKGILETVEQVEENCCDFYKKPNEITFKYTNSNIVDNSQDNKANVTTFNEPTFEEVYIVMTSNASDTTGSAYFKGNASPNTLVTAAASSLSTNLYIYIYNITRDTLIQSIQFHTSCSAPIIPGEQYGLLVLMQTVSKSGPCGFLKECQDQITYFPPTNFQGVDTLKLLVCVTDANSSVQCDSAQIRFIVSAVPPVAANDTLQNLPTNSSYYNQIIDVLANDYHRFKVPFALNSPLVAEPVSSSGTAVITDDFKVEYTNTQVVSGMVDSFAYKISTDCSCDTAKTYLAFGGPVPVSWLDVTARVVANKAIDIQWRTAQEINNQGFDIERSSNGIAFYKIGYVQGQGNSSQVESYSFTDLRPMYSDNYYRIKQIDFDGKFAYSRTVVGSLYDLGLLKVYPNPSNGEIHVTWSNFNNNRGDIEVTVMRATGQIVQAVEVNNAAEEVLLHLDEYNNGLYYIRVRASNGESYTKQVVLIK